MDPKISIIVPVYNVELYLGKCIDSILNQTFSGFELILVNDGSLDNCGSICDSFAKLDRRVKVIHKGNGGLSSARNAGLEIACGEYIGFVDSDDYIERQMYETLYNQATETSSDIVVCDFYMIDENGKILNNEKNQVIPSQVIEYINIQSLKAMFKIDGDIDFGTDLNPKWILM